MTNEEQGGFYCDKCGAICNGEQDCKHYPGQKTEKEFFKDMPTSIKELLNIK
jgi:hypothetical protein